MAGFTGGELNEISQALRIQLLGGFKVATGQRTIEAGEWRLHKSRSLVKVLALAPNHALHREQIMDLLWPELNIPAASNSLHQVLFNTRRILDPGQSQPSKFGDRYSRWRHSFNEAIRRIENSTM